MAVADTSAGISTGAAQTKGVGNGVLKRLPTIRGVASAYAKAASLTIATVFLASGILHLENPYYFLGSVYSYNITGPFVGQMIAMVVPIAQVTLAACLLGRVGVGGALLASAALSAMFAAAQVTGLWRELRIDCGCFGPAYAQTIGTGSILLAFSLLALALSAYIAWPRDDFSAMPATSDPNGPAAS